MWMDAQGVCEDGLWTPRLTMSARRCIKPPGHAINLIAIDSAALRRLTAQSHEMEVKEKGESTCTCTALVVSVSNNVQELCWALLLK